MSTTDSEEKSSIGLRLREERVRLGLSQADMGEVMQVDRKVIRYYEEDKTSPRADQLVELMLQGGDVVYIITGQKLPLSVHQPMASYLPRDTVAAEISRMTLNEDDAELLIALARRLCISRPVTA